MEVLNGIATVPAITAICFLAGAAVKGLKVKDEIIPVAVGAVGAALGAVALRAMPNFPATNIIDAVAIGAVSGLASTGLHQIGKQIEKLTE